MLHVPDVAELGDGFEPVDVDDGAAEEHENS